MSAWKKTPDASALTGINVAAAARAVACARRAAVMNEAARTRAELRALVQEQVLGAQQDGMKLGIKFGAKTLRDVADQIATDPATSPDYLRGLRDAAVMIEQFMEDAGVVGVVAAREALGISTPAKRGGFK